MRKRENRLPRDRQIIVDILNYDAEKKPSMWLRWFLGQHLLDSETLRQIRDELRGVLFEVAPNGRREYGPLVNAAQQYPIKVYPIALEDNKGVGTRPTSRTTHANTSIRPLSNPFRTKVFKPCSKAARTAVATTGTVATTAT